MDQSSSLQIILTCKKKVNKLIFDKFTNEKCTYFGVTGMRASPRGLEPCIRFHTVIMMFKITFLNSKIGALEADL